jgi:hypothetical protein
MFYAAKCICTTQNQSLQILNVGTLNTNQGPDFTNGKIKIDATTWAGDIELHINASDWLKHNHAGDKNYNKIILHVVYSADVEIKDQQGNIFPCLEMKNAINNNLISHFETLMQSTSAIACNAQLASVRSIVVQQQLEKVLIERLMQKGNHIQQLLIDAQNDWNEIFYITVARTFGGGVNNDAFEGLAARLPLRVLAKQKYSLLQIEAMLFGVAGLLDANSKDEYEQKLIAEYNFQKTKHGLQSMEATRWKFLRMRPQNFPTIRIAQLVQLIFNSNNLLSEILACDGDINKIKQFLNVEVNEYWQHHFTFNHPTENGTKKMGETQIHNIIINAIVPTLFVYGKYIDNAIYCDQAMQLLNNLPAENNKITKAFNSEFFENKNAANSQALIQQFKNYCDAKNCLNCSIGFSLLKKSTMS